MIQEPNVEEKPVKYKGVSIIQGRYYSARVTEYGKIRCLGIFSNIVSAAKVRDREYVKFRRETTDIHRLNFPDEIATITSYVPPPEHTKVIAHRNNKLGYRGVLYIARCKSFRAQSTDPVTKKPQYIGQFPTAEEAARAYDRYAIDAFGAKAKTNFAQESIVEAKKV